MNSTPKLAKPGDIIEWDIEGGMLTGTYRAKVTYVDTTEREYLVYAGYGTDRIMFDYARIVEEK